MNRSATVIALACAAFVVLSGVAVATPGAASAGGLDASDADERAALVGVEEIEESVDPDDVLLAIDVESDGDAVWTIEYRTRLETEDDEAAFEDLQADVEADPDAYTESFRERMDATADDASAATGREMEISGMEITTDRVELPREYGVVTYTFRWSNFAAVDGDRLVVGDAIDGLFLDDASELRIAWGDDRTLVEATPEPTEIRESQAIWRGPTTFSAGEPRVTLDPGGASDGMLSATTLAVLGVLVLFVAGAYAVASGRVRLPGRTDEDAAISDAGSESPDSPDRTDSPESTGSGGAEGAAGATGAAGVGAEGDAEDAAAEAEDPDGRDGDASTEDGDDPDSDGPDEADPFAGVDRELLSNEEQVMRLIEAHGGRMKQKRVAEELDWTAAKTSQVTKGLRDDGDLVGFRIGRENVLTLPEEDPR